MDLTLEGPKAIKGTPYWMGLGVVTSAPAPGGTAGGTLYGVFASWLVGGHGTFTLNGKKPDRPVKDDHVIETPAGLNHACIVTKGLDNVIHLTMLTELYGVEDC